jgi:hypothetical protein
MTHMRICIDDDVVFDGTLDAWQATPPDYFKDLITPDATPEPWLKAIMIVMADAVMTDQNVDIEATTGRDEWLIKVRMT